MESVPRSSRRAHFPSRHGEWDTPSRFWSHPTTASPTLRKARLKLEAAEELATLELCEIKMKKENEKSLRRRATSKAKPPVTDRG